MKTTTTEELMYQVMKAIYDSGIPVSFKGSMVLKACLAEAGLPEETRHTVDIDANWSSDSAPSAEQMTSSLQKALNNAGIGLQVRLYRMYGEGRSVLYLKSVRRQPLRGAAGAAKQRKRAGFFQCTSFPRRRIGIRLQ